MRWERDGDRDGDGSEIRLRCGWSEKETEMEKGSELETEMEKGSEMETEMEMGSEIEVWS